MSALKEAVLTVEANLSRLGNSRSFAESLLSQLKNRGYLSEKQTNCMLDLARRVDIADNARTLNLGAIRRLVDFAASKQVKRILLRLTLPEGRGGIVLRRAGNGIIYINDAERTYVHETTGQVRKLTYGKIDAEGFLTLYKAAAGLSKLLIDVLSRFNADPAKTATLEGHATGNCMFCALKLTDARSVEKGYGPICAGKFGLPWGEHPGSNYANVWQRVGGMTFEGADDNKTRLPKVLAEEYCATYVEDIPADIRANNIRAIHRMYATPDKYPNADWAKIDDMHDAIVRLGSVWHEQ